MRISDVWTQCARCAMSSKELFCAALAVPIMWVGVGPALPQVSLANSSRVGRSSGNVSPKLPCFRLHQLQNTTKSVHRCVSAGEINAPAPTLKVVKRCQLVEQGLKGQFQDKISTRWACRASAHVCVSSCASLFLSTMLAAHQEIFQNMIKYFNFWPVLSLIFVVLFHYFWERTAKYALWILPKSRPKTLV